MATIKKRMEGVHIKEHYEVNRDVTLRPIRTYHKLEQSCI
jgi:hypothetical protein